jgi:hypothetical protein
MSCTFYPLYPYGEEKGDTILDQGDNNAIHVELDATFKFYGYKYQSLYVRINLFRLATY